MNLVAICVSILIIFIISYFYYYERQLYMYEKVSRKRIDSLLMLLVLIGILVSLGYHIISIMLITPQRTFREDAPYLVVFAIIHFAWIMMNLIYIMNLSKRLSFIQELYGLKKCKIIKAITLFFLGAVPGIIYFQTQLIRLSKSDKSHSFL